LLAAAALVPFRLQFFIREQLLNMDYSVLASSLFSNFPELKRPFLQYSADQVRSLATAPDFQTDLLLLIQFSRAAKPQTNLNCPHAARILLVRKSL
jgi:hypothetical protein